jgi:hypothetical protein
MNFDLVGGRKMALTLTAVAVGTAIELLTERGLSPTFGAFLAGAIASFSAANVITTVKSLGIESSTATSEEPVAAPEVNKELEAKVEQLRAETEANLTQAANAIQGMGGAIENLKKVVTAIVSSKGA